MTSLIKLVNRGHGGQGKALPSQPGRRASAHRAFTRYFSAIAARTRSGVIGSVRTLAPTAL